MPNQTDDELDKIFKLEYLPHNLEQLEAFKARIHRYFQKIVMEELRRIEEEVKDINVDNDDEGATFFRIIGDRIAALEKELGDE